MKPMRLIVVAILIVAPVIVWVLVRGRSENVQVSAHDRSDTNSPGSDVVANSPRPSDVATMPPRRRSSTRIRAVEPALKSTTAKQTMPVSVDRPPIEKRPESPVESRFEQPSLKQTEDTTPVPEPVHSQDLSAPGVVDPPSFAGSVNTEQIEISPIELESPGHEEQLVPPVLEEESIEEAPEKTNIVADWEFELPLDNERDPEGDWSLLQPPSNSGATESVTETENQSNPKESQQTVKETVDVESTAKAPASASLNITGAESTSSLERSDIEKPVNDTWEHLSRAGQPTIVENRTSLPVSFVIKKRVYRVESNGTIDFNQQTPLSIRFDQGGGFGETETVLLTGMTYRFEVSREHGWRIRPVVQSESERRDK